MKTSEITTTNISLAYKKELKKMASAWGKSQMGFLQDCIYYFKVTGMNPATVEQFSPKEAIDKLSKRVDTALSFFQRHEKKLQPLADQLTILSAKISKTIETLPLSQDLSELNLQLISAADNLKNIAETENRHFEALKNGFTEGYNRHSKQLMKIEKMIDVMFQALSTRGLSGMKQELIDEFNEIVKTR